MTRDLFPGGMQFRLIFRVTIADSGSKLVASRKMNKLQNNWLFYKLLDSVPAVSYMLPLTDSCVSNVEWGWPATLFDPSLAFSSKLLRSRRKWLEMYR